MIDDSYHYDNNAENNDFTLSESKNAINSFSNKKSIGLDFIAYQLLKIIIEEYYSAVIFLHLINNIYNLSTYLEQLHISKLFLLKKNPIINTFDLDLIL